MQKDELYPTEQEWTIFFADNNIIFACTEEFKQELLKHPKVIEVYKQWVNQKEVK